MSDLGDVSTWTADPAFGALLQRVAGGGSGPTDGGLIATVQARYAGHPHYRLLEPLGVGGFGAVFLAEDFRLGDRVALKVLHAVTPQAIYRFKQEFRLLQQVIHPGLVRLFQLTCEAGQWFFTMEFVPGSELLSEPVTDVQALFRGLAEALMHLHGQGILHLDLKPSNVRVTESGRVVLLDFGLARVAGEDVTVDAGTPGYMAPEQWDGRPVGPATDWFAVGVMLFRVLAGRDRETHDRFFAEAEPSPLLTLCQELLADEPDERPTPTRIAELLGMDPPTDGQPAAPPPWMPSTPTVPGTVVAHGFDGRTNRRWADGLAAQLAQAGTLVLRSRCRVQEAIPFRAFDEWVDGLAQALKDLEPATRRALMPRDAPALAAVFPAFADGGTLTDDPELRRRAFFAFRELLGRLSRMRPVALIVDDAQWMDRDSVLPLLGLVDPPVALPVLLVVVCQGERLPEALGPAKALHTWAHASRTLIIEGDPASDIAASEDRIAAHATALAVVAAAGRPLELALAKRAAPDADFEAGVSADLLRWVGGDRLELASPTTRSALSDAQVQEAHRRLAEWEGEPLRRARHLDAGGHPDQAANVLRSAADAAFDAAHFPVACTLYDALAPLDPERRWRWAQSLARVGYVGQAGLLAREVAPLLPEERRRAVLLDAAQWLLSSGRVADGLQVAAEVLGPLGVRLPTSRVGRAWTAVTARARSHRAVPPLAGGPTDGPHRATTDACWTLGLRVATMDLLQGAPLLFGHLDRAAKGDDAGAYGRALAVEGVLRTVFGGIDGEPLLQQAEPLVAASGHPRDQGGLHLARAMAHVYAGAFPKALDACEQAAPFLAVSGADGVQDAVLLQGLRQLALYWTGRLDELRSVYLRAADLHRFRGDRFARVHLTTQFGWLAPLLADDPDRGRSLLEEAASVWSAPGVQTQRLTLIGAQVNTLLYAERFDEATARIASEQGAIRSSGLLLVPMHQLRWNGLLCRVELARLEAGAGGSLDALERRLQPRRWRGVTWVAGLRASMLGRLAALRGDAELAVEHLLQAEEQLQTHGLEAVRQATRWRRGQLLSGDAGDALVADAEAFFAGQGAARPDRLARFLG